MAQSTLRLTGLYKNLVKNAEKLNSVRCLATAAQPNRNPKIEYTKVNLNLILIFQNSNNA